MWEINCHHTRFTGPGGTGTECQIAALRLPDPVAIAHGGLQPRQPERMAVTENVTAEIQGYAALTVNEHCAGTE